MGRGGECRGRSGLVMRHNVESCVFEQSQESRTIFDTQSRERPSSNFRVPRPARNPSPPSSSVSTAHARSPLLRPSSPCPVCMHHSPPSPRLQAEGRAEWAAGDEGGRMGVPKISIGGVAILKIGLAF